MLVARSNGRVQGFAAGKILVGVAMLALAYVASGCSGVVAGNSAQNSSGGPGVSTTLAITTSSLSGGTVGAAYSATLQAAGGTSPYYWTVSTGTLPAGVSLASTGVISGKPTTAGASSFTVQVADAASKTASQALSLNVVAASNPGLTIKTSGLPDGQVSQIYQVTLAASGGTAPYSWGFTANSGPLPPGLSLAASTGQLSGTPSQAGSYSFTLQVSDNSAKPLTGTQEFTVDVVGTNLDAYGGRTDKKCVNATGWFHTEKIGSQWWLCTPLGNVFFMNGIEGVVPNQDNTFAQAVQAKYGSTQAWTQATNRRLLSWGFNTLTTGAYTGSMPFGTDSSYPVDSNGLQSQPVKIPFTLTIRAGIYSMINPVITNGAFSGRLITAPVKNMFYGHSPFYTGYVAAGGITDYYDTGIATWMQKDLQVDLPWTTLKTSPYINYIIGITSDDSDETNGFGNSPDFPTVPTGHNNYNLGMEVAAMSPVQTANSSLGWVYTNTLVHTKQALHDYLVTKYATVTALNTAWGSNYTTFDSTGVPVTGESVATGNGSILSFSHALSKVSAAPFSVQILVNGTPTAGDTGKGSIFGPNASGTINYGTGALALTFTSGHAPASGALITVNYIQNGWGTGTGFMDEDNRVSHQAWMGTDWIGMTNANPNVKADMNVFLGQMASQYFQTVSTQLKAVFPNIMYLGPDSLSTWGGPPPAPVLQAARQYLDAFLTGDSNVFTQAEMDYIEQNFGDKPYFGSFYSTANPDSALSAYPNHAPPSGFATQAARGQTYNTNMTQMLQSAHTTAGNFPYIGSIWWQYVDNWGEQLNWGIITHLDNAYDGHEVVTAAVPCTPPLSQYTCGGEATNYGDVITSVKAANMLWLTK